MNRKMRWYCVLNGALLLTVGIARCEAQEAPSSRAITIMRGSGPEPDMIGERIELLGFEGIHGGKVVTGMPFSAVAVSETTQTLSDGNRIARRTETNLFRDSQGRFRKEVTLPAIGPLSTSGKPDSFVSVDDPVAGTHIILHPEAKAAEKMEMPAGHMKEVIKGGLEEHQSKVSAENSVKREDLGTQTISGVSAQGTRITHTIPAGQIGNEKAMVIVFEHWYSNDLQMVVMTKRSDPRFGDTTYTLTNIQRSEPAASLFAVPPDYTVTSGKNRMYVHKMIGGPDGAPPTPPDN